MSPQKIFNLTANTIFITKNVCTKVLLVKKKLTNKDNTELHHTGAILCLNFVFPFACGLLYREEVYVSASQGSSFLFRCGFIGM